MASGRFHERLAGEKHLQRVVSKDEEKKTKMDGDVRSLGFT